MVGWTLALLAMVLFAALGRWQLGRMHEKQAMLDAVAATLAARDPKPLAVAADPARARDYDWAAGEGRFPDCPALLLDNQQREGRAGVRVFRVPALPEVIRMGLEAKAGKPATTSELQHH